MVYRKSQPETCPVKLERNRFYGKLVVLVGIVILGVLTATGVIK